MKELLRRSYHFLKSQLRIFRFIYSGLVNIGYKLNLLSIHDVPVVINNFNRITHLLHLIEFLEGCGFTNIIILDNNSTYPPLLDFYKDTKYKVIRGKHNYGHLAFWKSGLYNRYKWNFFIYTDSDVVPVQECPKDFIKWFKSILDTNYNLDKVGFGIKIDDLPDTFALKQKVIEYEKKYWKTKVGSNTYKAPIDTTFALYKPFSNLKMDQIYTLSAYRTGFPYLIRHLPWYVDSEHLSKEDLYFIETCSSSSSIGQHQKGEGQVY